MKIASVQMVSGTNLKANLHQARTLMGQAAQLGAELVVLPEYFCLMGVHDTDKLAVAEQPGHGPIQTMLREVALQHRMWVVGGTLPMATADPTKVANTTLVFAPDGSCAARYDKIHLFRFDNGRERYDESVFLIRGQEPVAFDLLNREGNRIRVGLSVCYDLRFPELYRQLQADLLLVPAAFTHTTGQAHWEVLLRARAIENQAFVLASAQGGEHANGRRTWGHSMVIDPWGQILAEQAHGEGVVMTELDLSVLRGARERLPALQHRVY